MGTGNTTIYFNTLFLIAKNMGILSLMCRYPLIEFPYEFWRLPELFPFILPIFLLPSCFITFYFISFYQFTVEIITHHPTSAMLCEKLLSKFEVSLWRDYVTVAGRVPYWGPGDKGPRDRGPFFFYFSEMSRYEPILKMFRSKKSTPFEAPK